MSDNAEDRIKSELRSRETLDPQFMKEFEKAVQSYGEAVSGERPEEAQNAAMQALFLAGQEALRNPTPSLLLKEKARNCEERGDWVGAEAAYREVLTLEESGGHSGMIAKAHMDLSRLLRSLGRLEEAWQFACQATVEARGTAIFPVLVMALTNESLCALDRQDYARALAAVSEAMQVIEPSKVYDLMRAKTQITRTRCLLVASDLAAADAALALSWETLKKQPASRLMQGLTQAHANWWEVKSQLEEQRGNVSGARDAMAKAIEHLRQLQGPYALFALAKALGRASALANLAGESPTAERDASEANGILRDLHLPPDH
jgi:tetratricopeptide (TPR) repeat protein